jgi:hypothetical protein
MKAPLKTAAWAVIGGTILHLALNPDSGVIFRSPATALALGMIGLGLCLEARKHANPAAAGHRPR